MYIINSVNDTKLPLIPEELAQHTARNFLDRLNNINMQVQRVFGDKLLPVLIAEHDAGEAGEEEDKENKAVEAVEVICLNF